MTVSGPAADVRPQRWGDLGVRAASGLVLLVVAIAVAWIGGAPFLVVWVAAAIAVLHEWLRLPGGGSAPLALVVGALALIVAALVARSDAGLAVLVLLVAAAAQAGLAGPARRAWTAGGQVYAGALVVSVTALRFSFPFGARAIFWLFAVVWSTDVFAYFGGRMIGGPKLWPAVSPSKTWSGTLTGVMAGAGIGTFAAVRDLTAPAVLLPVLLVSLLAAVISQAGDAFESALKRRFGVKDSGRLIPGHGGVMDRLDGFIAAAAFAFLVGWLRSRDLPSIAGGLFYWA